MIRPQFPLSLYDQAPSLPNHIIPKDAYGSPGVVLGQRVNQEWQGLEEWTRKPESEPAGWEGKRLWHTRSPALVPLLIHLSWPVVLMLLELNPGSVPLEVGLGTDVIILATSLRVVCEELDRVKATSPSCSVFQRLRPELAGGQVSGNLGCAPFTHVLMLSPFPWPQPHSSSDPTRPGSFPTVHVVFSLQARTLLPIVWVRKRKAKVFRSEFWKSLVLCVFRTFNLSFFFLINLFFNFWLHWVFAAARGLSLVAASSGYSSLQCSGFSLWWLLLLWSMGSRFSGFSSCSMRAQ